MSVNKDKIAISISSDILKQVDSRIDGISFKNRSSVIEGLIREGLSLKDDIGALIIAHESNWNSGEYPLDYPKALIQIDSKTILDKHLEALYKTDVTQCVITVSKDDDYIQTYIEQKKYKLHITLLRVEDSELTGTVINKARDLLKTSKVLAILGDNYFYPLDLNDIIYSHNNSNHSLTLVVKPLDSSETFGNVQIEGSDIVRFIEKPENREERSFIVNTGIYLFDSNILPEGKSEYKLESNFFPGYIARKKANAYFYNGKWFHFQSDEVLNLFK